MSARVLCFGELLLRLGAPGRELLLQSPQLTVHVGGAEANVAVALARLGHASAMLSAVPANALGAAAVGELRRHGVDTRALRSVDHGRMGLYFLESGAGQRPGSVLYDRAESTFALQSEDRWDFASALAGVEWLHLSGVTPALGPAAAAAAQRAVELATALGVRVSFDGNYRATLWERWDGRPAERLSALIAHADLLFAGPRDIDLLLGADTAERDPVAAIQRAAERAFRAYPRIGRMACTIRRTLSVDHHQLAAVMVCANGRVLQTPSIDILPIVDRIGTGDAFAAGVLHGVLSGVDDQQALDWGLASACLKHSVPGDLPLASAEDLRACALGDYAVRR